MSQEFDIFVALRERFAKPAWVYLEQVRNAPGWPTNLRTVDAVAMSVWNSRGLEIHGIEVKVSRSDWLKEKKTPEKAEEVFKFCDRWWLAVADVEIVQPGELPPTWGLLVRRGKGLVATVEAPKLKAKPISREFLAMMLRRATEVTADEKVIRAEVDKRLAAAKADLREEWDRQAKWKVEQADRLQKSVDEFEKASGVHLDDWRGGDVGAAVREVLRGSHATYRQRLENLAHTADHVAATIRQELKEHDELEVKPEVA